MSRFNRAQSGLTPKGDSALQAFDPYADKALVRLGLQDLGVQNVSPQARQQAERLRDMAEKRPALLRLLLLAHVAELSPLPLAGLETYDDLLLRFAHLGRSDKQPVRLEEALVEGDAYVEYGVRRATEKLVYVGLHFRQPSLREALPLALQALPVRRVFKQVLSVLGEHIPCEHCSTEVFAVPLYRLRGLDDLRALVCPTCGATLRSYFMARGQDVQAVLNAAFIDYEIVHEFTFALGRASISLQLVPCQLETLDVAALKQRVLVDVFSRHDIGITAAQLLLYQGKKRVSDQASLQALESNQFTMRFAKDAALSESDALELVRHRIRNRFR